MGDFSVSSAQQPRNEVLRIGASDSLELNTGVSDLSAAEALKKFIRDQTGFDNDIFKLRNWSELAEHMRHGKLDVGVFQGYEFAWAKGRYPQFRSLAVAVDVYPNPYVYVVGRADRVTSFAKLQGQTIAMPPSSEGELWLFIDNQTRNRGRSAESFFSRTTKPKNVEDALDDVVDGAVKAAAVERVGLEAYRRRKPGRFDRLKQLAHSPAFPPPVVASFGDQLDAAKAQKLVDGLLNANRTGDGRRLLDMFKLTGFAPTPPDYDDLLKATRRLYPPRKLEKDLRPGPSLRSYLKVPALYEWKKP
jgi:ABC-type phosphate/phosphonate transport system substrate-binding protein